MKSTGIVRKVDELGRVVLPKELRRTLDIDSRDPIEIYVDGDRIVLKKYASNNACSITGEISDKNISLAGGKLILSPEAAKTIVEEIQKNMQQA